jgi:SAM-dependent methyltransferase
MPIGDHHREALTRIMAAERPARAWVSGSQIPWNDPEFSSRMLAVHLDPTTHMASRSPDVISRHLDWLIAQFSGTVEAGGHILDVGCGPGLYCHELARRGYRATGFDFSGEPLAWAKSTAETENLDCRFFEADLTRLPDDFPETVGQVDVITFWFGEFHSFEPQVAAEFLARLAALLKPGGLFVLEYQPSAIFVTEDSSEWSAEDKSVFCDQPHLWLQEYSWDEEAGAEVHVHWIIEQQSGNLKRYIQCHHRWSDGDLVDLLADVGLVDPVHHPPITGCDEQFEFPLLVTRKSATSAGKER